MCIHLILPGSLQSVNVVSYLAGTSFSALLESPWKFIIWMNEFYYTACCWFPTSSNILILPSQFWQIRFESYWLHCSKCRILVLFRYFSSVAAEPFGPCGPVAHPLFELCRPGPPTFGITFFCFCFAYHHWSSTFSRTGPPTFKIVPPPLLLLHEFWLAFFKLLLSLQFALSSHRISHITAHLHSDISLTISLGHFHIQFPVIQLPI